MQTYIALLRGINVGGKKTIKMADLKKYFIDEDFEQVQTYIQSGNIVFKATNGNCSVFAKAIKEKILRVYGFDIPKVVLEVKSIEYILNDCPFPEEIKKQSYFTILHNKPEAAKIKEVNALDLKGEQYQVTPHCVYLYAPNGYGRAKGNNNFFEKKLKVRATTRNYKTVKKLIEMAS